MQNYVDFMTGNYVINIAIVSWFLAQMLKVVFNFIKTKKVNLLLLFSSGSLPSSHSAMVVGATTAVAKVCGIASVEFAIMLIFSFVVMYDASGVRRAAGEQAKVLNYMMENWEETSPEMFGNELKELLGHTPVEVLSGAILGVLVGVLL